MRHNNLTWLAAAVIMCIISTANRVLAVDRSKFRTCDQTQFCQKHRFDVAGHGDYHVIPSSVALVGHTLRFDLQQGAVTNGISKELLQGTLQFVLDESSSSVPAVRLHVSEKWDDPNDPKKRWENPDVLQANAFATRSFAQVKVDESGLANVNRETVLLKPQHSSADVIVAFRLAPFGVDVYLNKELVMSTNKDHQMHYERRRERITNVDAPSVTSAQPAVDVHGGKTIVDYGEDGLAIYDDGTVQKKAEVEETTDPSSNLSDEGWEESFGGHTDKKKYGPSSLGLDISFYGTHRPLYGIPEHATDFLLKDTVDTSTKQAVSDPYRLYNLDVFEYELDVPMTLYGSIPVLISPTSESTVGIFWHNPSETFVDIETTTDRTISHWLSESGVLDLFLILGPSSLEWFGQYTLLTGRASLPPLFSIGYHQCRWNYKNELDVARVDAGFDEHVIPYDVLWLDIEHTDGKRYFTWDSHAFPSPREMQDQIARTGRKMVTIVDPHIKVDTNYRIHQQATADGVYIKEEDGSTDFHGWCWPGDSSYVDFTSLRARRWWSSLFKYDQYQGSSENLYTWNDMNEPSVFNGPEVSMRKTCLNGQGVEHREWHNLYGYYMHQATMEGQLVRQLPSTTAATVSTLDHIPLSGHMLRPFVLSRAFFAGTQRFGAIWTGDNKADWGHLNYATKMLLSMSVTGLTFVGADVGGFFGNPDTELLTRWYQAAVYQPFFRGHAHHDSNRREPWVFGEPHTTHIRASIRERYSLLPYLYTLFHSCYKTGSPVMRPLWMHFPADSQSFTNEDQFLLGSDLLIKPITNPGVVETKVFLPSDGKTIWYQVFNQYKRYASGIVENVPAPIEFSPVFQRGGAVIPRKNRVRRSSALMVNDPFTLVVTLDAELKATGSLYIDDGETFAYADHLDRAYSVVQFSVSREKMCATVTTSKFESTAWIERIEIYGFAQHEKVMMPPKRVVLNGETSLETTYDINKDQLVIRKPSVSAIASWSIDWA